jgi:predicted glycoside hydrolase/deacetylase ChbG (UPF0249 family)
MAQAELAREMEAQFDRFVATELPFSHVDSHLHMHVNPAVFDLLLPLAVQYGACGLRLPRDDLWLALGYSRRGAGTKVAWAIVFAWLCHRCVRVLGTSSGSRPRDRPLAVTHRVYGLMQTGQMQEAYVVRLLHRLQVPTAELYFHPSTVAGNEPLGPNPEDLTALLSPAVRQVIQERNLDLVTYPTLQQSNSLRQMRR